ncbi:MAG: quinone oxidoreductase [Rhodospirillales bacterium]
MPKAAIIHKKGAPDVFRWEDVSVADPDPGEVLLRHTAIGVNYADTYHRRGINHPIFVPELPAVLGFEAVGKVIAVGDGVTEFAIGDKAAYGLPPLGAYAEERVYPVETLINVPDGIDDVALAGVLMKGMTARYLLKQTYAVAPGDVVLVHAAAGGMGHMLCPWAKHLGATVIGTVSSAAKAKTAKQLGCDHVIDYAKENFAERVLEITDGEGCHVVYESIGKDTLQKSLDCLRVRGMCAAYGHASGAPDPIDIISDLGKRGSLFITRPAVHHYLKKREDLLAAAHDLFEMMKSGVINSTVNCTYPLKDAALAHRAIENRETTGSTVLLPA